MLCWRLSERHHLDHELQTLCEGSMRMASPLVLSFSCVLNFEITLSETMRSRSEIPPVLAIVGQGVYFSICR
jgi:hypothetical protein